MSQFIIELGSANEHHNDIGYLAEMIEAVHSCDSGNHDVILKAQLFDHAPPNTPMFQRVFAYAYGYAYECGYRMTASVFDGDALEFLEHFDVPFIKIACRPDLYHMANATNHLVYMSGRTADALRSFPRNVTPLCCVPDYPADIKTYEAMFTREQLQFAVSDHTVGWELYEKYKPAIIEKHFCLKRSPGNPDSGPFAVTQAELAEVL